MSPKITAILTFFYRFFQYFFHYFIPTILQFKEFIMTNRMNWKWGDTTPICAKPLASAEIHIGDLLWLDTDGNAQPASTFAKNTDLSGTQTTFTQKFLGIAMQTSPVGVANPIRVATTGTFEFSDDTASSVTETLGTFVGPNLNTASTALKTDSVIAVTSSMNGIGRIVHLENVPAGKAYVAILSTVINGGLPASDPSHTKA